MSLNKQVTFLSLAILCLSCASSKKVIYSPAGSWEYVAKGTPNGDSHGIFVLTMVDNVLSGRMISDQYGESPMEDVVWEEGNLLRCNYFMADADLDLEGIFEGDYFLGTIDAGQYGVFPISANRKVEK